MLQPMRILHYEDIDIIFFFCWSCVISRVCVISRAVSDREFCVIYRTDRYFSFNYVCKKRMYKVGLQWLKNLF